MAEHQHLNDEACSRICNPLLTFDPVTFDAWVIISQADVDHLGLTKEELVASLINKYGKNINISIGQPVIFNKDDG